MARHRTEELRRRSYPEGMGRRFSTLSSRAAWLVTSLILAGCSADPVRKADRGGHHPNPRGGESGHGDAFRARGAAGGTIGSEGDSFGKTTSPTPKPQPEAVAHSSPAAVPTPVEPVVVASVTDAAATPKPIAEAPTPRAAPTKGAVATTADPGGVVEVTATKSGLTRIGAAKCKLCHQVQFASWAKTAHAARVPPLDCESCHGAGSEYKTLAIMKDPKKARAAGMVNPEAAFCARCHTSGVTLDFLKKAHAHKAGA